MFYSHVLAAESLYQSVAREYRRLFTIADFILHYFNLLLIVALLQSSDFLLQCFTFLSDRFMFKNLFKRFGNNFVGFLGSDFRLRTGKSGCLYWFNRSQLND